MKIKKSKIFIAIMLLLCFALSVMPMKVLANSEIGDVDIEGVTFDYNPGDAPKATAYKCDPWDELYDIEYEYWEEMETNEKGEAVPVKLWYSDESKNNALSQDKKITTFEDGKTYMYSISLKAKGENKFGNNSSVRVNGTEISSVSVFNSGTTLFVTAVKTIKPKTITYKHISVVEINNATISFKTGDKPVFSGTTPKNVPYIYQSEYWSTDGGKKYYYAADFWNINNPDDLFTKFESGKTYTYGIYFKAAEGYCFTTDTKLKINGKYYDYDTTDYDPMLQYNEGEYATMWVDTNLTMTPTENSQENPITPSETEKPSDDPVTPTTPTQETENKTEQTNNPKTGDNIVTFSIMFVLALTGIVLTTIINKKRAKNNK